MDNLPELQYELSEVCRELWVLKKQSKPHRALYLLKQDFLVWLNKQIGNTGSSYKQFNEFTREDIEKAIPVVEEQLKLIF